MEYRQQTERAEGPARREAKKTLALLAAVLILITMLAGCARETKTLHCDRCGKAVKVDADSNMDEDWILYCSKCEKELGLDQLVP